MNKVADKSIAWGCLVSGLAISAVSMYYSVVGLTLIFSAAVFPVMLMGIALETGKLAATVVAKRYWGSLPLFMRTYLIAAIVTLMAITSMGIYGFLSRAHSEQGSDATAAYAELKRIDTQIGMLTKTVDSSTKTLDQMDATIEQLLARGVSEQSAKNASYTRTAQKKERAVLMQTISDTQSKIAELEAEKAPFLEKTTHFEKEVGPIKYIAALLYGDNVSTELMERAVRIVILMIVSVFDVFAVILLLASQYIFQMIKNDGDDEKSDCGCNDTKSKEEPQVTDKEEIPPGEHIIMTLDDAIRLDDSHFSSGETTIQSSPDTTEQASVSSADYVSEVGFDEIDDMIAAETGIPEEAVVQASNQPLRRKLTASKGIRKRT